MRRRSSLLPSAARRLFELPKSPEPTAREPHGLGEWFSEWRQDLRFALRLFRKHAPLTLLVVFTLALGIGANAAIFSVVHRLLITPLPYADGDRIVMLSMEGREHSFSRPSSGVVNAWRTRAYARPLARDDRRGEHQRAGFERATRGAAQEGGSS